MALVRHLESSPWPVYNGGSRCKGFEQGEVRECSQELADYLVGTFPGCFSIEGEDAKPPPESAAVAAPSKDRSVKAPAKKKTVTIRKTSRKKGSP